MKPLLIGLVIGATAGWKLAHYLLRIDQIGCVE